MNVDWEATEKLVRFSLSKTRIRYDNYDDCKQEILMSVFKSIDSYDEAKGKWSTFVCTIAARKAANFIRDDMAYERRQGMALLSKYNINEGDLEYDERTETSGDIGGGCGVCDDGGSL